MDELYNSVFKILESVKGKNEFINTIIDDIMDDLELYETKKRKIVKLESKSNENYVLMVYLLLFHNKFSYISDIIDLRNVLITMIPFYIDKISKTVYSKAIQTNLREIQKRILNDREQKSIRVKSKENIEIKKIDTLLRENLGMIEKIMDILIEEGWIYDDDKKFVTVEYMQNSLSKQTGDVLKFEKELYLYRIQGEQKFVKRLSKWEAFLFESLIEELNGTKFEDIRKNYFKREIPSTKPKFNIVSGY
jgi:hypothetical protein